MANAVRSKALWIDDNVVGAFPAGLAYTCPANVTAIIKQATIAIPSGAGASEAVLWKVSGGVRAIILYVRQDTTFMQFATWTGFVVLEPGDTIRYGKFAGANVEIYTTGSGAELQGVAP